jgi:hypothetical protein
MSDFHKRQLKQRVRRNPHWIRTECGVCARRMKDEARCHQNAGRNAPTAAIRKTGPRDVVHSHDAVNFPLSLVGCSLSVTPFGAR